MSMVVTLLQVDPYMAKQNRSYIGGGTGSESGTGLMGMGGLNTPTDGHSQMSAMQHSALGGTMMGGKRENHGRINDSV